MASRSSSAAAATARCGCGALADGTPVAPPLDLPESVSGVVVYDNVVITAAGTDIAVHHLVRPQPTR
jgi:hypothetical protein